MKQKLIFLLCVAGALSACTKPSDEEKRAAIQDKLQRIIIPKAEFKNATVRETIELLNRRSVELDTTESDPKRRGVNLVLQADIPDDVRITLSFNNMPLMEALRYVSNLAGLRIKIVPGAVMIFPRDFYTEDEFVTKEYTVPPGILKPDKSEEKPNPERYSVKEWFQEMGVQFPPGTSAVYFPKSNKVLVRDTLNNPPFFRKAGSGADF